MSRTSQHQAFPPPGGSPLQPRSWAVWRGLPEGPPLSPGLVPRADGAEGYSGQPLSRTGLSLRPCPGGGMLLLHSRKHMGVLAVPSCLRPTSPCVIRES